MTFVCLVLIQFFNAYNCRSDWLSTCRRPFTNRWLNMAVGWELLALCVIVYVPFFQRAFGTFSLTAGDWALAGVGNEIFVGASINPPGRIEVYDREGNLLRVLDETTGLDRSIQLFSLAGGSGVGGHRVTLEAGEVITGLDFGNQSILGEIQGTKFEDADGDETDVSSTGFVLGPKLDYIILPGDKVQPFVGAVIGYQRDSSSVDDFDTTTSGFAFMARGGVRAFPGKEFSIDPWLGLSYFKGKVEYDLDGDSTDYDVSDLGLGVYLGISGWIR